MAYSKGINDYLNHYVLLADGKAALVIAAEVGLLAVLLGTDIQLDPLFRVLAAGAAALSLSLAGWVVLPRTPSSGIGVIFWGDIRAYGSVDSYQDAVASKSDPDWEKAYAAQNFHVSGVLIEKNRFVRLSLLAFFAAKLLAILSIVGAP